MTLTNILQKIPRRAFKDIIVYKIMVPLQNSETVKSPHRDYYYNMGEEHTAEIGFHYDYDGTHVTTGLHSFVKKEDALKFRYGSHAVYECKIPKGSTYYRGIWEYADRVYGATVPNIVSNRLIILKEIPNVGEK